MGHRRDGSDVRGKLLAGDIEAIPAVERRQSIGRNVRVWFALSETDQFNHLMTVAKAITSNDKSVQQDGILEWHIEWALDYVRRQQVINTIDQDMLNDFRETILKA